MATKKTAKKVSAAKKDLKAAAEKLDDAQEKIIDAAEAEISTRFAKVKKTAEQLWFAGLGVVGQSIDFAQSKYETVNSDIKENITKGKAFVDDLVDRGEEVQTKVDGKVEQAKELVEEKVSAAKSSITKIIDVPGHLKSLSDKLDTTSKKLDKATS